MKWLGALLLLAVLPLAQGQPELLDPTAPSGPAQTGNGNPLGTGWELNSTLINSHRKIAMINGSPVQEGDRIDGARVVRIRASEVQLETVERRITLRLLPNPLRTHAQP